MFERKINFVFWGIILVGILLAVWIITPLFKTPKLPETRINTDLKAGQLQKEIEALGEKINELGTATRKEVRVIREKTAQEVRSLPGSSIANELNDELAKFRGMGVRSSRMDDS